MNGDEERIWLLREVASKHPKGSQQMVIQYLAENKTAVLQETSDFECTTAVAIEKPVTGTKRKRGHSEAAPNCQHIRWVAGLEKSKLKRRMNELSGTGEQILPIKNFIPCFEHNGLAWGSVDEAPMSFLNTYLGEDNFNPQYGSVKLRLLYGDPLIAALYAFEDAEITIPNEVKLHEIKKAFARGSVPPKKLQSFLSFGRHIKLSTGDTRNGPLTSEHAGCLQALESAVNVYRSLPQATVALGVASKPLHEARWTGNLSNDDLQPCPLTQEQVFSCIAMFESGSFNIDPEMLKYVMALSTGNSIYVASPLLSDPWEATQRSDIQRVIGNIGRPGIAMMVPPQKPRLRTLDHDTWNCITHENFSGKVEDSFQQTTLHLGFSGWERPIDVDLHGAQDDPIYFLEAPISILDGGKWIGDLDILGTFRATNFSRVKSIRCSDDHHNNTTGNHPAEAVCIDRWEELIERPLEAGIVRARHNWQARLAATALSVQAGHDTVVLPSDFCWKCPIKLKTRKDTEGGFNYHSDTDHGIQEAKRMEAYRKDMKQGLDRYDATNQGSQEVGGMQESTLDEERRLPIYIM